MNLYRFFWDCGRQGSVEGIFAATEEAVAAAMGQQVYFGEILGKHSEVYGTLEAKDLELLNADENFIEQALEFGVIPSGYNPLDYLPESAEEGDGV